MSHAGKGHAILLSETIPRSKFVALHAGAEDNAGLAASFVEGIWLAAPEAERTQFDSWHEGEHISLSIRSADWPLIRRMAAVEGMPGPFTHLSLYCIAREEALASPERQAARSTAGRAKPAERDWFDPENAQFQRLGDRQAGQA